MSFGGGNGSFSFGNAANTGGSNQPPKPSFSFGGASNAQPASSSPAGGFSFGGGAGQPLGGANANSQQSAGGGGSGFSFAGGGSGNLFSGGAPNGSTTPASKPPFSFGTPAASVPTNPTPLSSTTPAAAPPTNLFAGFGKPAASTGGGTSLFGQQSASKPAESSIPASTPFAGFSNAQTPASTNTSGSASGFSFGGAAAPSTTAASSSAQTPAAPAAATATGSKPPAFSFNNATPASTSSGFSFGASKPAESGSTSAAAPASTTATAPSATPFSFGSTAPTTTPASTQPASSSLFSGFGKDKPPSSGMEAAKPPSFPGFGSTSNSKPDAAPTTGSSTLFAPKTAAPANSTANTSTPATAAPAAAPAPAGGLFSGFGKPLGSSDNKTPATGTASLGTPANSTAPKAPSAATGFQAPTSAAASTTAPAVSLPPPSMLRGRNMEEIVNKWSQDLENATKEFTRQAAEVAVWDGVLRRGGDEISRLIQALQAAEERQSSIEQTLDYVEQQQADLTSLLDGYEAQVAELLQGATTMGLNAYGSQGVTRSMETGAADAERERAYAMAESLNSQLDELSRNLSSMIVEVNNLSSSTAAARPQAEPDANALGPLRLGNKLHNSGADPVSQIVAILNAHLGSLKWIDESTNALREKVENLRRGQIGGEARSNRDRATASPASHRQEAAGGSSTNRNRQSSVGPGGGNLDTLRASSVGPGYARGASVGRNAGSGWSEATIATGGGSNLGRSRGYGL